ncbi:MAG: hypothetical protein RLZZ618_977 [Pseudomonadota bacterium]|jgi:hypothetical protein
MKNSPMFARRFGLSVLVLAASGVIAACSDGDDWTEPPVAKEEAPASAADSVTAFVNFTQSLEATETAESLELNLVALAPVSESDDPVILN